MTKKILKYILPILALTSCSDDFEPNFPGRLEDDGTLYLSFGIAPLQSVSTRSSDVLGEVKMYVYDANGTTQLQSATVDMVGTKGTVLLNSDVINEKDNSGNNVARFYFVANAPAVTGSIDIESGLLSATVTKYENFAEQLTMSSDCIVGVNAVTTNTVPLIHNAAKVSVNKGQKKVTTLTGDDNNDYEAVAATKYAFATYGTSKNGFLMAGGLSSVATNATSLYLKGYDTTAAYGDLNGATYSVDEKFVLATDNTTVGNAKESFIVVKAAYGTEGLDRRDYYYRLDFQKRVPVEGKTPIEYTTKALDILPNHHYQFLILNISGRGYDTAEEAAKNPSPMVEYQIHDHSPVIYNMISDGSRELGVQDKGEASSTDDKIEFYVKVFSKDSSEETFTASNLSTEASWISGISVSPVSSSDSNAWGNSSTGDADDKGSMYKVTLILNQNAVETGLLENSITVAWQGLSREVKLVWDRQFDPSKLFDPEVKLRIYDYEETEWVDGYYFNSDDYFTDFLTGKVVGASSSANNGVSRTQGLHFPMPYGDGDQWSYVYELSLNPDLATGEFTWEVSAEGVNGIDFSRTSGDQDNLTFYMSRFNSPDDFDYQEGHLNIKITSGGQTTTYTNVKLYHTGFFHDDSPTSAFNNGIVPSITSSPKTKFTYYEVVSGGGDHWLDRNIGATSAGMYVEGGGGDAAAKGYYMYISKYVKHQDPEVCEGTVPPGYDVPTVEQWNTLKADGKFNIRMDGAYYIPELKDGTKTVYFPKSMYFEGSGAADKRGESRAGYYWTKDAASGTEKEEIGNWLKAMCISGTSTSYVNAKVNGKTSDGVAETPFYLNLRAVAKGDGGIKHPQKFQFYVAGATHVYLYIQNADGTRTQAYNWPGKQIGNSETADQTFAFSYETVSANVSDIRVIFNYVGTDNKIYTYSDNDFDGSTTTHTNISPKEAVGWFVLGSDQNNDFKKTDCKVKINTSTSRNGTTWAIRDKTGTAPAPTDTEKTYRILWSKDGGFSQIRISMANGTVLQPFTAPSYTSYGFPNSGDTQYYAFDWTTTMDADYGNVKLEFKNSSTQETKIGGKETYSLTDFDTWIHKFYGIVIGTLNSPANQTASFSLYGSAFANTEKNLKEENGKWKGVFITKYGYFYVKKNLSTGGSTNIKRATSVSGVDLGSPMAALEGSGYYWKGLPAGTYTFTYDPEAKTLTVEEGGDPWAGRTGFVIGESLRIRTKHQYNNKAQDKTGIYMWYDGNAPVDNVDWSGSISATETVTVDNVTYRQRTIKFDRNCASVNFEVNADNSDVKKNQKIEFSKAKAKYDANAGMFVIDLKDDGSPDY